MQQLLAHQLAAQQLATVNPGTVNPLSGLSNGVAQSGAWTQQQPGAWTQQQPGAWTQQQPGAWTQQQPNQEQINPAMTPRHHLLQQLAQYHYLVAQQLAQLAAQQALQSSVNPYAGQFQGAGPFIPGPLGANFVPGITMH